MINKTRRKGMNTVTPAIGKPGGQIIFSDLQNLNGEENDLTF